jgi:phospholipid-binding lipoprotein MlaA
MRPLRVPGRGGRPLFVAAFALLASACATVPSDRPGASADAASPAAGDPYEGFNRSMFKLGMSLDRAIARPIAHAYIRAFSPTVRNGVHNVLQNLDEPLVFMNDVLQVRPSRAARTVGRFATNSTLGFAGIVDVAAKNGLPPQDNDFGATLAHYGIGSGPYLFVPLLGPSDARDLTGGVVDFFSDPVKYVRFKGDTAFDLTRTAVGAVDSRASVDSAMNALDTSAADPYATVRSVYRQKRAADLSGGKSTIESLPDLPEEEPSPAPAPSAEPPAAATPPAPSPPAATPAAPPEAPAEPTPAPKAGPD